MNMYFIAILAPEEINTEVLKWKYFLRDRFGCTAALKSPAHITLIPPFWMKEDLEKDIIVSLADFSKSQVKFPIHLKDFSSFKPKVLFINVLKNEYLDFMHNALTEFFIAQEKYSVKKDDRPFHPHVTLATRDLYKKAFSEVWEIFSGKKYEAAWIASGISLLRHNKKNWDVIATTRFPE